MVIADRNDLIRWTPKVYGDKDNYIIACDCNELWILSEHKVKGELEFEELQVLREELRAFEEARSKWNEIEIPYREIQSQIRALPFYKLTLGHKLRAECRQLKDKVNLTKANLDAFIAKYSSEAHLKHRIDMFEEAVERLLEEEADIEWRRVQIIDILHPTWKCEDNTQIDVEETPVLETPRFVHRLLKQDLRPDELRSLNEMIEKNYGLKPKLFPDDNGYVLKGSVTIEDIWRRMYSW